MPRATKLPRSEMETPMSIVTLRRLVLDLDARQPVTDRYENREPGERSVWYSSQKEHWAGWLFHYEGPGYYGRKTWNRTAEFVYNHFNCPPGVLWLAEASGVNRKFITKAARSARASGPAFPSICAAIRREVPWALVEAALAKRAVSVKSLSRRSE